MAISLPYSPARHGHLPTDAPFIHVKVKSAVLDQYVSFDFLVDSGADSTIIPKELAEMLGLTEYDLPDGTSWGIGGHVHVRGATLGVAVEAPDGQRYPLSMHCVVLQDPASKVPPLLGRAPFFDLFDVTFKQRDLTLVLEHR